MNQNAASNPSEPASRGTLHATFVKHFGVSKEINLAVEVCETMIMNLHDGFSLLDLKGNHVYVNPALCEMTGFSHEDLVGSAPPYLYWPPEEVDRIKTSLQDTLKGEIQEFQLVFKRRNEERFPVLVSPSPFTTPDGTIIGYSATVKDITSLLKADLQARRASQRMKLHVDQTPMAVIEWDSEFCVKQWNPAAETIFGYTEQEALGQHSAFVVPEEARHLVSMVWDELISQHGGTRSSNHNIRKDGRQITCEWYNTPLITKEGTVTGVASLAMDITDRIEAEEQLRTLNSELELRVCKRTHELQTAHDTLVSRNAQLRALTIQLTDAKDAERRRIARLIHDNHQQMLVVAKMKLDLVQESLSDIASVEAVQAVDQILNDVIKDSRSLTRDLSPPVLADAGLAAALGWLAQWMEANHHLRITIDHPPHEARFDRETEQVIFNAVRELLFNVAKHAGVDEATVLIKRDMHHLNVTVRDKGSGFLPTTILESPRTFGLFNLQEQISLLNGSVEISSHPGEGTVITLSVKTPTLVDTDCATNVRARNNPVRAADGEGGSTENNPIRILVADDHALVRQGLIDLLRNQPDLKPIGEAENGRQAVAMAHQLSPDVILMDVSMPEMSGLEAARAISASMPNVNIIGLSMHSHDDMAQQMIAAGACGYRSKNEPTSELIADIRRVASKQAPRG